MTVLSKMKKRKSKTITELQSIIRDVQNDGKTVVFANGCFDLIHAGHVSYLESAAECGDILVVGLNSDASVKELKDERRPIIPEHERVEILCEMECVDYVTLFEDRTADPILKTLRPNVHAKGTDYTRETVPERITAQEIGASTCIVGNSKENATKDIIAEILERYT